MIDRDRPQVAGGVELLLRLADQADAMFETFRPGVAERLGIGPQICMARNPRLVYGRMTGWGQDGPWAQVALLAVLGLDPAELPDQTDRTAWPAMKERFAAIFRSKSRDEWCAAMEGHDACFAPVLRMSEAIRHPHNAHRGVFVEVDGIPQPAPVPRFGRTPGAIQRPPAPPGRHTDEVLAEWLGLDSEAIEAHRHSGSLS